VERTRQPSLSSVGSLTALNGIQVSAEVAGIVSQIAFDSGQRVAAGDVLVQLDDRVDQAELEALRADRRLAEIEYRRLQELLPKKAVSKSDYDTARAAYQSANARVLEQQARIERKTIKAPFSGLLGIRQADLGQYLNPGAGIVGLQALDPIYLDYSLPERYYRQLEVGQTVEAQLDALPGERFSGRITAIDAAIGEGTRTVRLRAELANPQGVLRPGMFAEVRTLTGAPQRVLTVPRTAVSFNTYGDFVMVLEPLEDDRHQAKRRQIETGEALGEAVVVRSGLEAGETVIAAGLNKVRPGQPVMIDNSVQLNTAGVDTP
jgi:membrane fusion protein (multidrug efflux system)